MGQPAAAALTRGGAVAAAEKDEGEATPRNQDTKTPRQKRKAPVAARSRPRFMVVADT